MPFNIKLPFGPKVTVTGHRGKLAQKHVRQDKDTMYADYGAHNLQPPRTRLPPSISIRRTTPYTQLPTSKSVVAATRNVPCWEGTADLIDAVHDHLQLGLAAAQADKSKPAVVLLGEDHHRQSSLMVSLAAIAAMPHSPPASLLFELPARDLTNLIEAAQPVQTGHGRTAGVTREMQFQGEAYEAARLRGMHVSVFDSLHASAPNLDVREAAMVDSIRLTHGARAGPVIVKARALHVAKLHECLQNDAHVLTISSIESEPTLPNNRKRFGYLLSTPGILCYRPSRELEIVGAIDECKRKLARRAQPLARALSATEARDAARKLVNNVRTDWSPDDVHGSSPQENEWRKRLKDTLTIADGFWANADHVFGCFFEGEPAGLMAMSRPSEPAQPWEIDHFVTHPGGTGAGGALMEQAATLSQQQGSGGTLFAITNDSSDPAYEAMGFVQQGYRMQLDPASAENRGRWQLLDGEWRVAKSLAKPLANTMFEMSDRASKQPAATASDLPVEALSQ